jgi:hypothetical protein
LIVPLQDAQLETFVVWRYRSAIHLSNIRLQALNADDNKISMIALMALLMPLLATPL